MTPRLEIGIDVGDADAGTHPLIADVSVHVLKVAEQTELQLGLRAKVRVPTL